MKEGAQVKDDKKITKFFAVILEWVWITPKIQERLFTKLCK
jgi:hypothetical protein